VDFVSREKAKKRSDWELFPWILVRFATVPRSALARTRLTETLRTVKQTNTLRRDLVASSEILSSRLYTLIPQLNGHDRREALDTRRKIFHLEAPTGTGWINRVGAIDPLLGADLTAWIARRQELASAKSECDAMYDREVVQCGHLLWSLLNDASFRRGLSLANPLLAAHLVTLEGRQPERLSARERTWLMRAVRYLHRAALKPTPFGFFAGVALAQEGLDRPDAHLDVSRLVSFSKCATDGISESDANRQDKPKRPPMAYLDPGAFEDVNGVWAISRETGKPTMVNQAETVFAYLARSSRTAVPSSDLRHSFPSEVVQKLASEGVIGLSVEDIHTYAGYRDISVDSSAQATQYEDAVHPAVLRIHSDLFSGFVEEVLHYGARTVYPSVLPEQQGLARLFAEMYDENRDVPVLAFFRDFLSARRERGLDHLGISEAASHLSGSPDVSLQAAAEPLAKALRHALSAGGTEKEAALALDLSPFAGWQSVASTRHSILLAPGPGGLSGSRFWIRLWGAERMSLVPRYASALASVAPNLIEDFRAFLRLWPEAADLCGGTEQGVDTRPILTDRTIDLPGCRPLAGGIALRDLRVRLDRSTGRLTLAESQSSGRRVKPVFFGVTSAPFRPLLYQFLEILDGHQVTLFELLLRTLSRVLTEDSVWTQVGFLKLLPALALGEHVMLSPRIARIDASTIPNITSKSRRQAFLDFHQWWDQCNLPTIALVHVPQGSMSVDLGSPDGIRSFYGHIRGAARIHLLFPFTTDDNSLESIRGESHEVEFALEIATGSAR
jgi:hypothetical protein